MNTRLERVGQLIRDEIADILRREIDDPLIGFVTLTEVEVSPDLRYAKVFFSVLGTPVQVQESIKGMRRARKHINALLGERLDLRYIPRLRFVYDDTAVKAQRLEALLRSEHEELGADLQRHEPQADEDEDFNDQFEGEEPDEDDFEEEDEDEDDDFVADEAEEESS